METEALTIQGYGAVMRPQDMVQVKTLIRTVMNDVMKDGEHFGKIPGCGNKPALLKAGAETLMVTFGLRTEHIVERVDLPNGHREYHVTTNVLTGGGMKIAQGVGSCSTMESKYRYRGGKAPEEVTENQVPSEYWNARKDKASAEQLQSILARVMGKPGRYGTKKNDAEQWVITIKGESTGEKAENPDIADTFNTVLKMAKKRSMVDATLTSLACSDFFTQDIEELGQREAEYAAKDTERETGVPPAEQGKTATKPAPQKLSKEDHAARAKVTRDLRQNAAASEKALDKALPKEPVDPLADFPEGMVGTAVVQAEEAPAPAKEEKKPAASVLVSVNGLTFEQWKVMSDEARTKAGHISNSQISYITKLCGEKGIAPAVMLNELGNEYPDLKVKLEKSWQMSKDMGRKLIDALMKIGN